MNSYELFRKNTKLAYYTLHRYIPKYSQDEDMKQVALLGLWKACLTFDERRNCRFSTYAMKCILNQVNQEFRKTRVPTISIETPISDDGLTLGDILVDTKTEVEDTTAADFSKFINYLSEVDKKIIKYLLLGLRQREIAKILHIKQPSVSRHIKSIKKRYYNYLGDNI